MNASELDRDPAPTPAAPSAKLIFGTSPAMERLRLAAFDVARTEAPVLIEGENGCGKEALALWLHDRSPRAAARFVKVRCLALPEPPGGAATAGGGTLFLDEIAGVAPPAQARLLDLLQGVGPQSGHTACDLRPICATALDLEAEVRAGRFRSDLFYRLAVVRLELPPLRARIEDVPGLVAHFADLFARRYGREVAPLSPTTLRLLAAHSWPGNIRELENLIHRYAIFASEAAIVAELLRPAGSPKPEPGPISLRRVARQAGLAAQRQVILRALHAHRWNRRKTAQALNISYRALLYKLHDTGIPTDSGAARRPQGQ